MIEDLNPLPRGYHERMSQLTISLIDTALEINAISQEFDGKSVKISNGDIIITIEKDE